jgi:hypothetical protein
MLVRRLLATALAGLAAAAAALVSQHAMAQATAHRQVISMGGGGNANARPQDDVSAPARLFPIQASMTQAYPTISANADGSDLWPCYGHTTPNGDCPTVGNPVLPLPKGAMVAGVPAHSWALENGDIFGSGIGNGIGCDAFVNGTTGLAAAQYKPCGQIATFVEDDTNDPTDEHLQRVIVTQGSNVIFDSGIVDFGPLGPGATYPVVFELYYDTNFGYWPGAESGPNNGNCTPDIAYPLMAPANPGFYQVAGGSTCQRPVPGKAHVHAETVLATPSYHQVSGQRCTAHNVASPCYTVTWDGKHKMVQDWDVFLR